MHRIPSPSSPKIRPHHAKVEAHKRMALAALRGDHSLSVRLERYNRHMCKARALEAKGVRHA